MTRFKLAAALLIIALPACAQDVRNGSQSNGGGITAGTTIISGTCASGNFLYNNSGVVGCSASGSSITLPQAVAGTVTSGGIPYFNTTAQMSSSAVLTANALVKGGGAGVAPSTVTTGTGVLTALGVNVGSNGAFVVNGGALGTPSSGSAANLTGLPIGSGVSGLGTGVATALGVAVGSAGAFDTNNGAVTLSNKTISGASNTLTNIPLSAFTNLGTTTTVLHGNAAGNPTFGAVSLTADVSGVLPVANGGSGTASPGLVAGTNVTISGSWPNQTINASGGGSPGGTTGAVQYNNAGAFGGLNGTGYVYANGASAPTIGTPVTSIATSCGVSGGTITTTGTISAAMTRRNVTSGTANDPIVSGDCGNAVQYNEVTTPNQVVFLDNAALGTNGFTKVYNLGSQNMVLKPTTSGTPTGTINGVAASTGFTLAPNQTADLIYTGSNTWFATPTPSSGSPTSLLATAAQPSFSGNNQTTIGAGTATYSGSNLPANTGIFAIGGTYAAAGEPASSADGNAWIGLSTSKGLELGGRGSGGDISFFNANGSLTCYFPHNFGGIDCANFRVDNAIQISDAGSTYYPLIYAPNTNTGGGTTVAASGPFGSSAPTPVGMSTAAFQITVGASPSGTDGTMTFSQAAKTGWACDAQDITTTTVTIKMNATSRSTTVQHFTFSSTPNASDVLVFKCMSY